LGRGFRSLKSGRYFFALVVRPRAGVLPFGFAFASRDGFFFFIVFAMLLSPVIVASDATDEKVQLFARFGNYAA